MSLPVAVVAWAAGAEPVDGALLLGIAAVATVVALSGDLGRVFVQASAYGEEDRHLLRPPTGYLFAVLVSWAIWAAATISGPLLLGERAWVLGGVVSGFAIVTTIWAWPRWHSLSRRWLVVVPIGLVVHDHLVLAETVMLRRQEIATARLAPSDTQAADLTGPAAGHAIEINTDRSGDRDPGRHPEGAGRQGDPPDRLSGRSDAARSGAGCRSPTPTTGRLSAVRRSRSTIRQAGHDSLLAKSAKSPTSADAPQRAAIPPPSTR